MDKAILETKFGEANKEYKKYRPTYPDTLFETIMESVSVPYKKVLDIGAGTGISTRILAEIFEEVIAIEPDERMISAGNFGDNVNVINECTENARINETFNLITAGNAFYWMEAELVLPQIHGWLKENGIFAAYRYNLPLTDNEEVNKVICRESEMNWDHYRHERLRDTGYTYRNINVSSLFQNVKLINIDNVVPLVTEALVGFFASTSYGSAYIRSNDDPHYLSRLLEKINEVNCSTIINVDFSLELVVARKSNCSIF